MSKIKAVYSNFAYARHLLVHEGCWYGSNTLIIIIEALRAIKNIIENRNIIIIIIETLIGRPDRTGPAYRGADTAR